MTFIDFHTHRPTAEGVATPRCFGIHPWLAPVDVDGYALPMADEVDIVGECGLDKCAHAPWESQKELFAWHISLAERWNKPMVIHCVRAFNELIALRKNHRKIPWVVHGFMGGKELYEQLRAHGIGISLGKAVLDARRTKVRETLMSLRDEELLLETDDSEVNIADIYRCVAELRGMNIVELAAQIELNYSIIIGRSDAARKQQ